MARRATIICTILDWDDILWDVRRRAATPHDFLCYHGWPHGWPRGAGGVGGPSWILTPPLVAWLESVRFGATTKLHDMPFGRSALKRMRRQFGHSGKLDRRAWWLERLDDLESLNSADFAARHVRSGEMLSAAAVDLARMELFGERGRTLAVWREQASLILSGLPTQIIADKMELAVDVVCKMRWKLEDEQGLPHHRDLKRYDR